MAMPAAARPRETCVAIRAKISAKGSQMVKREAGLRGVEPRCST